MENKKLLLNEIGNKIRKVRIDSGFSQEVLAQLADLDRSYYGGIERGERNLSAINLVRIASALGKEVGDLFPPIEDLANLL